MENKTLKILEKFITFCGYFFVESAMLSAYCKLILQLGRSEKQFLLETGRSQIFLRCINMLTSLKQSHPKTCIDLTSILRM